MIASIDGVGRQFAKAVRSMPWLLAYGAQRSLRPRRRRPEHLIIALADHFEPSIVPEAGAAAKFAERAEQMRRVRSWSTQYPEAVGAWRDDDGWPLRHTYFYPAEQYDEDIVARLAEHCREGWGEIEIHLHHGLEGPDTSSGTRGALLEFVERLGRLGALSRWNGEGPLRYAFVHGNWALANSAGGRYCGVDDEMAILSETGCYADMTLPSAPHPAQVGKINALYECARPLDRPAPHRRGRDLRVGGAPTRFPLIVQGPLGLDFARRVRGVPVPRIENGEVTGAHGPTLGRLALWREAGITVRGRREWVFIKLHCHGMDPRDHAAMLGAPVQDFLRRLLAARAEDGYRVHFVTAREMVNIALAACDGRDGDPGQYRDYRLRAATPPRRP